MATSKPVGPEMCIVNSEYMMPVDEGLALMRLLSGAVAVERNWSSGTNGGPPYKYTKNSGGREQTLTMLSPSIVAMMELEKDTA